MLFFTYDVHFRSDFRHNFSYQFFSIYIARDPIEFTANPSSESILISAIWSFVPQIVILIYSAILLAPLQNISATLL